MELQERKARFDELCTALELMDLAEEADSSMVLPSLLKGFDDANLRLAILAQASRNDEEFSNKLAMSIVATINAYESEKYDADEVGELFIQAMAIGANLTTMWGHKVETIKFLVNIIQANEVFESGIPAIVMPPITALLGGVPEPIFKESFKFKTPYELLEMEVE